MGHLAADYIDFFPHHIHNLLLFASSVAYYSQFVVDTALKYVASAFAAASLVYLVYMAFDNTDFAVVDMASDNMDTVVASSVVDMA